jgi:hypothetical protein
MNGKILCDGKKEERFFYYIFHRLAPRKQRIPEIIIALRRIFISKNHEPFYDTGRQLKRIHIYHAGKMNVMEITYQRNDLQNAGPREIHIPAPKGKTERNYTGPGKIIKTTNPLSVKGTGTFFTLRACRSSMCNYDQAGIIGNKKNVSRGNEQMPPPVNALKVLGPGAFFI